MDLTKATPELASGVKTAAADQENFI